jgi:hypothetical protein
LCCNKDYRAETDDIDLVVLTGKEKAWENKQMEQLRKGMTSGLGRIMGRAKGLASRGEGMDRREGHLDGSNEAEDRRKKRGKDGTLGEE